MSDLIRREDAIRAVAEVLSLNRFASFKDIKDFGRFAERMLRNVPSADRPQDDEFKNFDRESLILLIEAQKERIGELLADRPQEWIPCSEKLPSENGDYLVTLENGVVKILGYSTTQRTTYPKGFYHIEDGFSWRQIQNPVVAWMPLPKPWKGADDE